MSVHFQRLSRFNKTKPAYLLKFNQNEFDANNYDYAGNGTISEDLMLCSQEAL
ncbi:hypothetical protein GCM10022209_21430 [Chitinophaga oryziterrae]